MPNKFDEYSDILNRLVNETIACSPEEWSKGTLSIESDGVRINYKLKNESEPGTATISEKLRDLIDEFYVRMSQRGEAWLEAEVTFHITNDNVNFKTSFKYPPKENLAITPQKKSWWKMWQ